MAGRMALNQKARKLIADYCERHNIVNCENCGGNFGMAPAHKENRRHHRTVEELADYKNWIALCQRCHTEIESNKDKTEALFSRLR